MYQEWNFWLSSHAAVGFSLGFKLWFCCVLTRRHALGMEVFVELRDEVGKTVAVRRVEKAFFQQRGLQILKRRSCVTSEAVGVGGGECKRWMGRGEGRENGHYNHSVQCVGCVGCGDSLALSLCHIHTRGTAQW